MTTHENHKNPVARVEILDDNSSIPSSEASSWFGSANSKSSTLPSLRQDIGLVIEKRASLPHLPLSRKSNDLSDLTINKLNFKGLSLYGREEQVEALKAIWDKALQLSGSNGGDTYRSLITISGASGTGKTKLSDVFHKLSVKAGKGLYVRGKFDRNKDSKGQKRKSGPYSGISRACAEILGALLNLQQQDAEKVASIEQEIRETLGSELFLLEKFIPALAEVIDMDALSRSSATSASKLSAGESKNQVVFCFLRFIRIFAGHFQPLVIALDDLQWADKASLDLFEALALDGSINAIVLVGIFRSEEVDTNHPLHTRMLHLADNSTLNNEFHLTRLVTENLGIKDTQKLLEDLLAIDSVEAKTTQVEKRIASLAHLCMEKTRGNVFFLLQYLISIRDKNLFGFNFGTMKWEWDEHEIRLQTSATGNVTGLLQAKLSNLPRASAELLKAAACLGSIFPLRCLDVLYDESIHSKGSDVDFGGLLQSLESQGFLAVYMETPIRTYTWAHDTIHEAALSMIPEEVRSSFVRHNGQLLLAKLDDKEIDASLFIIVNMLNAGKSSRPAGENDVSDWDLARWNCRASKKAVAISAFESAAEYAGHGIRLLPESKWAQDYQLSLDLCTHGAKAEGFLGRTESMQRFCRDVLTQKFGDEAGKIPIYNIMVDSMVSRGQVSDAVALALDVLKRFDCGFPTSKVSVGFSVLRFILRLKPKMERTLPSKLHRMDDPTREGLMELMKRLNLCFYIQGDFRYPLTGFRVVDWAAKYGYSGTSAIGFAQVGVVVIAILSDFNAGATFGERAIELIEMTRCERLKASVLMISYIFLFPWTRPMNTLLAPVVQGYNLGLKYGDIESATTASLHYIILKYMDGASLETLDGELALYSKQMKELHRSLMFKLSRFFRQAFLNLRGVNNAENPLLLVGDALPQDGNDEAELEPLLWAARLTFGGIIRTFFGDHVSLADEMVQHGSNCVTKIFVASPTGMLDTFMKGISCYAAAIETGNKKHIKVARQLHSKVKKWSKANNPNVKRYEMFLDAESMVLKGQHAKAIKLYEETIKLSARIGCQQDTAFACERLGLVFLNVMKDREEARYRLAQSRSYWLSFGANAKVLQLDAKFSGLLDPVTGSFLLSASATSFTNNWE